MKTIEKIVVFLCTYIFCGWGTLFVQNANALDEGKLRVFAYDLRYEYTPGEDGSVLGTYEFYFKSNIRPTEGYLYFYYDNDGDDNRNEAGTRVGQYKLPTDVFNTKTSDGEYFFSMSKAAIPQIATNKRAFKNMTWAIELHGDKIIGNDPVATDSLNYITKNEWSYNYQSYIGETNNGVLGKQVREPRRLMEDSKFQWPQGIAIDNNPQSPYFGRVYIANTPAKAGMGDGDVSISTSAYQAGIVIYEPDPQSGTYKKLSEVTIPNLFPAQVDQHSYFYMHNIAVNPENGYVYFCKSTSSTPSAIYQLKPTAQGLDRENIVNVTANLIQSTTDSLNPINSFAFGPSGELYIMSKAYLTDDSGCGTGKIYKLTQTDNDDLYDGVVKHYIPRTEPQTTKIGVTAGEPVNINPWVDPDNSMVVNARGGFWVSQKRYGGIDPYAFLAHIHPDGYEEKSTYGRNLQKHFQFAMSTVERETFSGLTITPHSTTKQLLSPHTPILGLDPLYPTGQIALYEKGGMNSTEALLAVGFKHQVSVFKLFYNDKNGTWFGFNLEWMFEIPIGGEETTIDGLAFDYAGNLFVASGSRHKLYLYSLPNYDAMNTDYDPSVQPLTFNARGGRNYYFVNANDSTKAYNNLNRGNPLNDNYVAVPAKFDLTVDAAIVYDQEYNKDKFDTQWSTEKNWNIEKTPTKTDYPVVIRSNAIIDETQAEAGGLILEKNSNLTITYTGGLTVGADNITGWNPKGTSIEIQNYSTITKHIGERPSGAGYLRIHPSVKEEDMPRVTVDYHTKSQPSEEQGATDNDRLWQYVGAPGKGTTVEVKEKETWLYRWYDEWGWVKLSGNVELIPFAGYTITQENHPEYTWATTPINQNKEIELEHAGWGDNVFTNSYLAPINIAALDSADFEGDMNKTFYLFNTGSWNEWQAAINEPENGVLTDDQSPGQYTAIPVLSAENINNNTDPTTIAPMQGVYVWVKEKGCKIKLDYEKLVWNTTNPGNRPMTLPEHKRVSNNLLRRIRIQAYGKNSGSDRMYILQDLRCTPGYDNGYDGFNMTANGQVNIYTNEPCGMMEISASNQIDSMYIGFCAGPDTTYTLRFTSLIGESLYIKDLANDSIIALTEEGEYTFHAPAKSVNDMRFQVLLDIDLPNTTPDGGDVTTDIPNVSNENIWITSDHICIATGTPNNHVKVYHVNGQEVMNKHFDYQTSLPINNLGTGVYVVRVNDVVYKFVKQD